MVKLLACTLLCAQALIVSADAFAAETGCHCVHAEDDPTPCPCPTHRKHAKEGDEMPPCPMHRHATPLAGPGMRAGCGMGAPQLSLSTWFNWTPAPAAAVEQQVIRPAEEVTLEPPPFSARPARPPPRSEL